MLMAVLPGKFSLLQCRLPEGNPYERFQHAVFHVLEADSSRAARIVDFFIFGLVLFSAVNLAVGNASLELIFVSVFAAEYVIRLWCIVWHRDYCQQCRSKDRSKGRSKGGFKERLRYATTNAAAIIDFIAIWPTLIVMIIFGEVEVLPIFRLISRLIMTGRRFPAMRLMGRVMLRSASQLISVLVTLGVFWLAAGYLMNYAESNLPGGNHDQFGTIGESLWASVVVLTTLPSLEVVPGTLAGRVIAGFIALLGIGLFALPAGILTSNFMDAYQQERENPGGQQKRVCYLESDTKRRRWPGIIAVRAAAASGGGAICPTGFPPATAGPRREHTARCECPSPDSRAARR